MNLGGSSVDVGSLGGFGEYIQLLEEYATQYATILLISVIASYVLLFVFACIGGTIAGKKGRKRAGWFFLILFFGLIPFIIICCLKSKKVIVKQEDKWTCAKCGASNVGGYTCAKCGAWKSNSEQEQISTNQPLTADQTATQTGAVQGNTVVYTEQQPMPDLNPNGIPWACVCGQQNEPDSIYCCACGRVKQ